MTATTYDYVATTSFEIQGVQVVSPPPHLKNLCRLVNCIFPHTIHISISLFEASRVLLCLPASHLCERVSPFIHKSVSPSEQPPKTAIPAKILACIILRRPRLHPQISLLDRVADMAWRISFGFPFCEVC